MPLKNTWRDKDTMSTKEHGYMNEDLDEIKEQYKKTQKRLEEIKKARKQKNEARTGKPKKIPMKNITINIPNIYDAKIQELIKKKLTPSRSEAVRTALREFLHNEYNTNLELLGFFDYQK